MRRPGQFNNLLAASDPPRFCNGRRVKAYREAATRGIGSVLLAALVGSLLSCARAPTSLEHLRRETDLVGLYLKTNAPGAEAAMLELEKYTRRCERGGTRRVDFARTYAAIYSRLYLVEKRLGKREAAERYYHQAVSSWRLGCVAKGLLSPSDQEVLERIEGVDSRLQEPAWKRQNGASPSL